MRFRAGGIAIVSLLVGVLFVVGARPAAAEGTENEIAVESRELLREIDKDIEQVEALRAERDSAEGEQQTVIELRRYQLVRETLARVDSLVENIARLEQEQVPTTDLRPPAEKLLSRLAPLARERIESLRTEIAGMSVEQESLSGADLVDLEGRIADVNDTLNTVLDAALQNTENMEMLGLPAEAERAFLTATLTDRAENIAARIELTLDQTSGLSDRLEETPDDTDLKAELKAGESKRDRATANLSSAIKMMERLGLDTSKYQRILIASTGEITTDILDTKVALGLLQQWLGRVNEWIIDNGPGYIFKVLLFLLILFGFHLLARVTKKVVRKTVSTSRLNLSQLLQSMFVSGAGNLVRVLGLLVALSQMGFALGPILAGLGIMGFIVGFALQETLANFAAGMMILVYRPYDVGDLIESAGVFGKVNAMSMVSTTVLTVDNQTLIVPNGKIWGDVIKNVTHQKVRRVDMVFGISYTDDIPHTEKVLAEILAEHPKVLKEPESMIKLHTLGESSVDFIVRPWVNTDDYWDVYWDVTREVKMRFDREGISIPFPQRDVHLFEEKRLAAAGTGQA